MIAFLSDLRLTFPVVFVLTLLHHSYLDSLTMGVRGHFYLRRTGFALLNTSMACILLKIYEMGRWESPTISIPLLLVIVAELEHLFMTNDSRGSYLLLGSVSVMNYVLVYLMTYALWRMLPVSYYGLGCSVYQRLVFNVASILVCGFNVLHFWSWFPKDEIRYIVHMPRYNKLQSIWFPLNNAVILASCMMLLPIAQRSAMGRSMELMFYGLLLIWTSNTLISCYAVVLVQCKQVKDHDEMYRELQESREREKRAGEQAEIDELTGLWNRRGWEKRVQAALEEGGGGCMVVMDLDHFKDINDNLGHTEGDIVLREVASVLQNTFRKGDIIGRMGGDEFTIFLCRVTQRRETEEVLSRLLEQIRKEYKKRDGERFYLSFSAGYALVESEHDTIESLLIKADKAMYEVKRHGRCGFTCHIS